MSDKTKTAYWHGGVPGLKPGDILQPGHNRKLRDGCPYCEARARGEAHQGIDGPSQHADKIYLTTDRLYAKHYASLYGRGWLYRVEPLGDVQRSTEDSMPSYTADAARIVSVYARAVLLTMSERRRLWRAWTKADAASVPESGPGPDRPAEAIVATAH